MSLERYWTHPKLQAFVQVIEGVEAIARFYRLIFPREKGSLLRFDWTCDVKSYGLVKPLNTWIDL